MKKRFRFLLVEDIKLRAASNWIKANLPGIQDEDIKGVDSFVEAWGLISESDKYDGFILDMDLNFDPAGTQGSFPEYEKKVEELWPDYYRFILEGRIKTGGLWLWAYANKIYKGAAPPTIFFTGHGMEFGIFLEPMKWSGMVFWDAKNFETREEDDKERERKAKKILLTDIDVIAKNWGNYFVPLRNYLLGQEIDNSKTKLLSALLRCALRVPTEKDELKILKDFINDAEMLKNDLIKKRLPLEEEKITMEGTNQDVSNPDLFKLFMESIRLRLFKERFLSNIYETLNGTSYNAYWCELTDCEEGPEDFKVPSVFLEYDFEKKEEIGRDLDDILNEFHKQSQIVALNSIFSGEKAPLQWMVHTRGSRDIWDPRTEDGKTGGNEIKEQSFLPFFGLLREDIRGEVLSKVLEVLRQKDVTEAQIKAEELSIFIREEPIGGLYIPKPVRDKLEGILGSLRYTFGDRRSNLHKPWRENVKGYLSKGTTIVLYKKDVDDRLKKGGELYRLAKNCISFLNPYLVVYDPRKKCSWVRNLLETYGEWVKDNEYKVDWEIPKDRIPIQIKLIPMT